MVAQANLIQCKKCCQQKRESEFNSRSKSTCVECQKKANKRYYKLRRLKNYINRFGVNALLPLGLEEENKTPVMQFGNTISDAFVGTCEFVLQQRNVLVAQRSGLPRFCALTIVPLSRYQIKNRCRHREFISHEDQEQVGFELIGKRFELKYFINKGLVDKTDYMCYFEVDGFEYRGFCGFIWPEDLTINQLVDGASILDKHVAKVLETCRKEA